MPRTCLVGLLLFCSAIGTARADGDYMPPAKRGMLRLAQEAVLKDDFRALDSLHTAFQQAYPGDPAHYLISVAEQMALMSYQEEAIQPDSFVALTERMFHEALHRVDTAAPSAKSWYYLIAGHARLYRSLYEARFGSKFLAMRHGFGAMEYYQKGFRCDSNNLDLQLGMGSFRYWKSTKAGILRTLGLIRNERDLGILELEAVSARAEISSCAAKSALVYVYLDMDSLSRAYDLAHELLRDYPQGRSMKWALADILTKMDSSSAARSVYQSLRAGLTLQPGNFYNLISCDAAIARSFKDEGDNSSARVHARVALASYPGLDKDVRRRQSARLEKLRSIADETAATAIAIPFTK